MSNFFSCPRSISVVWYLFLFSCTVSAQERCDLIESSVIVTKDLTPGCAFQLDIRICEGRCKSWTTPASPDELLTNPEQAFVSRSRCCAMVKSEIISENVLCGTELQNITVKSATLCRCEPHTCGKDN
ncbi:uncharacterized protein LOC105685358 [Athalia rosae]|uniref:uncharacterized protein LOC105685358 n=1 Tax=Athalia rosae TaxID=37344 RepID=UPI000625816C|nr:uncharacterized protein LOC105685358 [Athalia rosae]